MAITRLGGHFCHPAGGPFWPVPWLSLVLSFLWVNHTVCSRCLVLHSDIMCVTHPHHCLAGAPSLQIFLPSPLYVTVAEKKRGALPPRGVLSQRNREACGLDAVTDIFTCVYTRTTVQAALSYMNIHGHMWIHTWPTYRFCT